VGPSAETKRAEDLLEEALVSQRIDSNRKVGPGGEDHGPAQRLSILWTIPHDTLVHGLILLRMHLMMAFHSLSSSENLLMISQIKR
jgi:hypothetical protein